MFPPINKTPNATLMLHATLFPCPVAPPHGTRHALSINNHGAKSYYKNAQSFGHATCSKPVEWEHKVNRHQNCPTSPLERKEQVMNWDQIAGNWKQVKGVVREKWGKLTEDDVDVIAGKRDKRLKENAP